MFLWTQKFNLISESFQSDLPKSLWTAVCLISTGLSFEELLFDKRFRKSESKNTTKRNSKSPDLQFLFCLNNQNFSDSFFSFQVEIFTKNSNSEKNKKSKSVGLTLFKYSDWFSVNGKSMFCFQIHFWFGFSEQEFHFWIFRGLLFPLSILFSFSFSGWEFQVLNGWWILFQFNYVFRTWKTSLSIFNLFPGFFLSCVL